MLIQANERKLTKVINVYSNGDVEIYNVTEENVTEAESRIRDVDMAEEMSE